MPNTDIRPLLETIIKQKSIASQNNMKREFKQALTLAKQAFEGVGIQPEMIRATAKTFARRDNKVFSAMTSIADIIDRQMRLF